MKNIVEKVKNFVKENKKSVIVGGIGALFLIISISGALMLTQSNNTVAKEKSEKKQEAVESKSRTQDLLESLVSCENIAPSIEEIKALRQIDNDNITIDEMLNLLKKQKANKKEIIDLAQYAKYFPFGYTKKDKEELIEGLLKKYANQT